MLNFLHFQVQEWLIINNKRTPPEKEFFPKPEQRTDGSYIYERIPSVGGDNNSNSPSGRQQMLYKKRAYEEKPVDTSPVPNKVRQHLFLIIFSFCNNILSTGWQASRQRVQRQPGYTKGRK